VEQPALQTLRRPCGCALCREHGGGSRTIAAELIELTEEVRLVDGDQIDGLVELGLAALVEAEELVVLAERRGPTPRDALAQACAR
jgi:hypothetical protein